MRVICTYCSASKDPAKGLLPAFKRYISQRIIQVQEIAESEGVGFCILSGKFGLVDWDQLLPLYDHLLLAEEVQQLADTVTHQLVKKNITRMEYYTRLPKVDPNVSQYASTIDVACRSAHVELRICILDEPKITSGIPKWKQITEMAADARQTLIRDRPKGEQEFDELFLIFPRDGMVFFQRAIGYETIGDFTHAKADYEAAKRLFPAERWQWEAQEALNRIEDELAVGGTIAEARRRINRLTKVGERLRRDALLAMGKASTEPASTIAELRPCLEGLVNKLLAQNSLTSTGELNVKIRTLSAQAVVPEIILNHMNTIRIMGNSVLHPKSGELALLPSDVYPSITALVAILEWLESNESQVINKSTHSSGV